MTTEKKPVAMRIRLGGLKVKSDVIYIAEAAEKLGISKDAMRMKVFRMTTTGADQGIPAPFMLGGKWAWKRADFDAYIDKLANSQAKE